VQATSQPRLSGVLTVVEGPNPGDAFRFDDKCDIGRGNDCAARLPSTTVSRRHARIFRRGTTFMLEHLSAINPTMVNQTPVVGTAQLRHGDMITVGAVKLRFGLEAKGGNRMSTSVPPAVSVVADSLAPEIVGAVPSSSDFFDGIEGSGSFDDVRRLLTGLKSITAVARAITGNFEPNELLGEILSRVLDVFPETTTAAVLLPDDSGELAPRSARRRHKARNAELQVSRTVLQHVVTAREAVLSRDARHDSRFHNQLSVHVSGARSIMAAPLIFRGEVLGVLYLDSEILGAFGKHDLELLNGVADQCAMALGAANLHAELLQRHRFEQDLNLANEIQKSFLPQATPDLPGWQFWASYSPALQVGGDFYDFVPLVSGKLGIVIGDISGKGVAAALYMARLTRDLRHLAVSGKGAGQVLAELNQIIIDWNRTNVFVTLLFAELEPTTGRLTVANAGHLPGVLRHAQQRKYTMVGQEAGLPLGIMPDITYETEEHVFRGGDTLVLFTDGVTESTSEGGEMFGAERVVEALSRGPSKPAFLGQRLVSAVSEHAKGAAPFDDTTVVCFGLQDTSASLSDDETVTAKELQAILD
jgi:phosphoserine phosphatase RsbU/P